MGSGVFLLMCRKSFKIVDLKQWIHWLWFPFILLKIRDWFNLCSASVICSQISETRNYTNKYCLKIAISSQEQGTLVLVSFSYFLPFYGKCYSWILINRITFDLSIIEVYWCTSWTPVKKWMRFIQSRFLEITYLPIELFRIEFYRIYRIYIICRKLFLVVLKMKITKSSPPQIL